MALLIKILKRSGLVLLLLLLLFLLAKEIADTRYFNDYDPAFPLDARIEKTERIDRNGELFGVARKTRFESIKFSFEARPGDRVPALLNLPFEHSGKLPVIVLLHGIGQSKDFLNEVCTPFNEAGFAMASFDQYSRGERKVGKGVFKQALAFRQRPWRTINDTRRLLDYLQTREDIDPNRMYLVGASYGAITGSTASAFDKRIQAAVLVVGGGNLRLLTNGSTLIRESRHPVLYKMLQPLACYFMKPADPIRYVEQMAPRPLLFLNGQLDTMVTPEAGQALFDAAKDPKEIRWYPCDHPGLVESEGHYVVEMLDEALAWLKKKDAEHTTSK